MKASKMMRLKAFIFLSLLTSSSWALDLKSEVKESKSQISPSLEISQFSISEGTLTGTGGKIDFSHNFTKGMNVELYFSTALTAKGSSLQSSFTGLGGYIFYSLWGDCCDLRKTHSIDGVSIITETVESKNSLEIGVGLDQFFLNGSKAVYSSSGFGVGMNYRFRLFDYNLKFSTKYSMLTANNVAASGIFFGLGMIFPL